MTDLLPLTTSVLPPLQFGQYERGCELGHGASGRVFECTKSGSDMLLAVKAMDLRGMRLSMNAERKLKNMHRELEILKSLPPHPKIVQMVDALEEGDWFFLVLELVRGGDLFNILMDRPGPKPRLLECEASFVFWQLVEGLEFLHSHNIIHRDLKLENVLIASEQRSVMSVLYNVRISDFGLAKAVGNSLSEPHSMVGTQRYAAPEIVTSATSYDYGVDLWSLGVLLYILLQGSYPHDRPTHISQAALDRIVIQVDTSAVAQSIMKELLRLDPAHRATLEAIRKRTWTGAERSARCDLRSASTVSLRSSQSLFGSEDGMLPPPAPGATPMLEPSDSVLSIAPDATAPATAMAAPGVVELGRPSTASVLGLAEGEPSQHVLGLRMRRGAQSNEDVSPIAQAAPERTEAASGTRREEGDSSDTAKHLPVPLGPEASIALSNVRAATAGLNEIQLHIVVPDRFAGAVLGKGGARIRRIKATTGCNTWMTPRDGGAGRCLVIVGGYAQCTAAQIMFVEQLSEAMHANEQELKDVTVVLFLRNEVVGAVVGKQGSTLQNIHKQSGARIKLLRDEVEGRRPCIVSGVFRNVLEAEKLVFDLVQGISASPRIHAMGANATNKRLGASAMVSPKRLRADDSQAQLKVRRRPRQSSTAAAPKKSRRGGDAEATAAEVQAQTKFLIPSQTAGAVIGKQGSGLKHIHTTFHVRIEVLPQAEAPQWPSDRVVILHGCLAHRQAAADAVLRAAFPSLGAICKFKVLVSSMQAAVLDTKLSAGGDLHTVGDLCGVHVHVEPDGRQQNGERIVVAEGQITQVVAVSTAVLGILDQVGPSPGARGAAQTVEG